MDWQDVVHVLDDHVFVVVLPVTLFDLVEVDDQTLQLLGWQEQAVQALQLFNG